MANKIDNVISAIATKLNELVDGTLKVVKRRVIIPATVGPALPELGIALSTFRRERNTWICDLELFLVVQKGGGEPDEAITEVVAKVDDKIVVLIDAHTAGGVIDRPIWDAWLDPSDPDSPLSIIGAVGRVRIRVEDPILVS